MEINSNGIDVKGATKTYGFGKSEFAALDSCYIHIPKNCIYGLLGPSGCGKTTLLRAILGRSSLTRGSVSISGKRPGARGLGFPGKNVGYMPQELALYRGFSIREIFIFNGWINEMTFAEIKIRTDFLIDLLDLPEKTRKIDTLSGGQQRRVSFAAALLHKPDYLILDEPTVGVDPLLRSKIWDHLFEMVQNSTTTIILTTHYIEEARRANIVGLMRKGRLLAEDNPEALIAQFGGNTLESVFLMLCCESDNGTTKLQGETYQNLQYKHLLSQSDKEPKPSSTKTSFFYSLCCICMIWPNWNNVCARLYKEVTFLKRNPGIMFFTVFFPVIEICIFLLAVGGPPLGLPIAVVNDESPPSFSVLYLESLSKTMIDQINYPTYEEAVRAGRNGHLFAIVHIGENFTQDLLERYLVKSPSPEVIQGSQINISLDMTSQINAMNLQLEFSTAFQKFMDILLNEFHIDSSILALPINFIEPIYGTAKLEFTDYMAPGLLLSVLFGFQAGHTSVAGIVERKEGLIDRAAASGVKYAEVLIGFFAIQVLILSFQVFFSMIAILYIFHVSLLGSVFAVYFYCLLQGWVGIASGLFVASVCELETSAVQLGMMFIYPLLFFSGVLWPLEAIPIPLRYVSYILPQTMAGYGIRDIFLKGWSFFQPEVLIGYGISIFYIIFFGSVAAIFRTCKD